ncbi:MAG: hypothetical protein HFG49_04660 [Lachnospiraceae bacterium]|jgi:hypothetical protein|nr:hypothetical protein [Lachnospiraceae bacterium]
MGNKNRMRKVMIISLSEAMVCGRVSSAYANTQSLPNGTIITQDGTKFLTDSKGEKYSGWFIDSKEDWYYFNESNKTMKTGWHHDDEDGYWYYLNLSDGKMVTGWQTIEGKEYFFQPVRDMGNYHFNNEQEKWLYVVNSKVPYGAMYVNTTTPDGFKVDGTGAKVVAEEEAKPAEINYANILEGTFISKTEYESYQWWIENEDTIINDERVKKGYNEYEMRKLAATYYPEIKDLYWVETHISSDGFSLTAEQGIGGKGLISGSIIWKGNDRATMVYDRNMGSADLKVIDNNTIEIDGDILIRVK